jgi:hypothetical protein
MFALTSTTVSSLPPPLAMKGGGAEPQTGDEEWVVIKASDIMIGI